MSNESGMVSHSINVGGVGVTFQGAGIDGLTESEYTLVTLVVDVTGSTMGFTDQLRQATIDIVEGCRGDRFDRRDYVLLRLVLFSSDYRSTGGVLEIHGFKPVMEIDTNTYPDFGTWGATPLWDAGFNGLVSIGEQAKQLHESDYSSNGLLVVLTDGVEGDASGRPISKATPAKIVQVAAKLRTGEVLESLLMILIGVNVAECRDQLERFSRDAKFDHFRDAGEVSARMFEKLAGFVVNSISSQSQALGTGGPSKAIAPTI